MEVRVLGHVEVAHRGGVVAIRGTRQRALLAILALRRGDVVPAERLVELLWGDAPPGNPANALQALVSAVRKLLPEPVLATRGSGYALDVGPDDVDADAFEAEVGEGRRLLEADRPAEAAAVLSEALGRWRGPALADFAYDEWARNDIARLEESRLAALQARIEADLAAGRHAALIGELEALCDAHPTREALWGRLMVALYRAGRQADALRVFAEARRRLVEELGLEPGPDLRRLEAMVLAHDAALDLPNAPRPASAGPSARPGNLRARLSRFVGREAELTEVAGLLADRRLVTLLGPGGAGKTRLAVEVADRLARAEDAGAGVDDGAWLVELAPVTDPAGVVQAVASALGVGDASDLRDLDTASPVGRIIRHLERRSPLVVVDNCEHVIGAAAAVVDELLGAVPGLRVLATSREPLGVPGEALVAVAPLDPDAAVELFADRATAADRTFVLDGDARELAADICRRLDGLPLAIELAAARLHALPLAQVAARLDDRFRLLTGGARTALPRQQTLRAVVDWSYDLLFEDERRLFARLAAFPGGCVAAAAEAVCGDERLPEGDVVDLLSRLVDKSLVVLDRDPAGAARYRQLQTLWEYARERLAESGEADVVRDRHADWYRALAVEAEDGLRGADGPAWRSRLDAEVDNLRAALDRCIEQGRADHAVELVTGMGWLWFLRADWHEAVRWFRDALATQGGATPAVAARGQAWLAYYSAVIEAPDDHVAAGQEALEVLRTSGSAKDVGEAALLLASSLNRAGRFDEVLSVLEEGQAALLEAGHSWGHAVGHMLAATALARLGRFEEAEAAARASVDALEALGERWTIVEPLGTIAALQVVRGDFDAALDAYDRVIAAARSLELPGYLSFWLLWRAAVSAVLGDDASAAEGFADSVALSRNPANMAMALVGGARARVRLGVDPPGAEGVAADLRRARELFAGIDRTDGAVVVVVAEGLGALEAGDLPSARRLAAQADALDPAAAALLAAALALQDGDRARAAALLSEWGDHHFPPLPGVVASLLAPDHAVLAAAAAPAAAG